MNDDVEPWEELCYTLVTAIVCETGAADYIVRSVWRGNVSAMVLPQLAGRRMVTDGGMETDLIFHHGVDLPLFAAFPLVDSPEGRSLLTAYYDGYAAIARRAGAGLMLESATWRANPDWGDQLGYSPADLARVNRDAITMLAELRDRYRDDGLAEVAISGMVGPRGDGYQPGEEPGPDEAAGLRRGPDPGPRPGRRRHRLGLHPHQHRRGDRDRPRRRRRGRAGGHLVHHGDRRPAPWRRVAGRGDHTGRRRGQPGLLPGQLRAPGARGGGPGRTRRLAGADLRRAVQRLDAEPR